MLEDLNLEARSGSGELFSNAPLNPPAASAQTYLPTCPRFPGTWYSCSGVLNQFFHAGKVPSHFVLTVRIQQQNIVWGEFSTVGSEPHLNPLVPTRPSTPRIQTNQDASSKNHQGASDFRLQTHCYSSSELTAAMRGLRTTRFTMYAIATCRLSNMLLKKANCRSACALSGI